MVVGMLSNILNSFFIILLVKNNIYLEKISNKVLKPQQLGSLPKTKNSYRYKLI